MATQRCLDAIAATRRASGRDDAAPLDPAAPATELRATHHVGDRPRHGRAWNMTSASAREATLRPDAVLSTATSSARVDVSWPLDPLRCSDLSHHVVLFLCFARFIRLLFLFGRPVPPLFVSNPPATVFGCQKSVLISANRCYTLPSLLRDDAPRRRVRRAALQHCSMLLQTSQLLITAMRATRYDATPRRPPRTRPSLRRRASKLAQSRRDETRPRR